MFDDVIRELQRLERSIKISIDLEIDEDGFLDRVCPNSNCAIDFKVLFDDWRDKVQDKVVYCPNCRFEAESGEWNTPEQLEYIEQTAERYILQKLDKALTRDTRRFNRS